jgi:hypothetical protein
MKKKAMRMAVATGVTFALASTVPSGARADIKNVLSTNVLNLFIGTFSAEYEYATSPTMGLFGVFRYGSFKIGDHETSWPGFSAGVHFYPREKAPEGFFWGPLLYANLMTTTFSDFWTGKKEDVSATFIGPMVEGGHRWNWDGFTLGLSLQFGFLAGSLENPFVPGDELSYGGFAWGLGANVGYGF